VSEVRVEGDWFELEALDADDIRAVLPLPAGCAEPMLVFEEKFINR